MSAARAANADRRMLLWLCGGVVLLILITALFAPATHDDDPVPRTTNSGTHGAKAAFLLLGTLGYNVTASEQSTVATLDTADAPHTTYLLATPFAPGPDAQKTEYAAVERFLRRGGRVLATGFHGAYFLPGGRTGEATQIVSGLCNTTVDSRSLYSATGSVALYDSTPWSSEEPAVRTDHRCGADAVVVHRPYPHGGEMVWWASAEPLSNRGIAQDSSLQLLLASLGPATGPGARRVIFDEFYHGEQTAATDYLEGLPTRSLMVQAVLLAALLLFTYSRRSGPLRDPVRTPRTSPVEFARNMGALYERAHATAPATEAARRRLLHVLSAQCGLTPEVLSGSAHSIAQAVHARLAIDTHMLESLLDRADAARHDRLRPRDALNLVRGIDAEIARLQQALHPVANSSLGNLTTSSAPLETT